MEGIGMAVTIWVSLHCKENKDDLGSRSDESRMTIYYSKHAKGKDIAN